LNAYQGTVAAYQARVEGEVHDFVRSYRSDPRTALHGFDRVAHLRPATVYELEVTSGDRLLAIWEEQSLILADLGDHNTTARYSKIAYLVDSIANEPAPARFWPDTEVPRLFADRPDETVTEYATEMSPDWIYWLSDDQREAVRSIVNDWGDLPSNNYVVHFVIGGPGTGKTSVLINLLKEFVELGCDMGISISDRLADYLRACLRTSAIDDYRRDFSTGSPEILLIDDPASHGEIYRPMRDIAGPAHTRMLVVAFDPCQLEDSLSDKSFRNLVTKHDVAVHQLRQCYRQKKTVGRAAQSAFNVIAQSSAFLRDDKIAKFRHDHEELTRISNSIAFVNPGGYSRSYLPKAALADLRSELDRVSRRYPRWKHWPGIVAVIDSESSMPREWVAELEAAGADIVDRSALGEIKGLEYQHAFLFFGPDLQKRITEVVNGQSRTGYFETRVPRTSKPHVHGPLGVEVVAGPVGYALPVRKGRGRWRASPREANDDCLTVPRSASAALGVWTSICEFRRRLNRPGLHGNTLGRICDAQPHGPDPCVVKPKPLEGHAWPAQRQVGDGRLACFLGQHSPLLGV
jgi:hypothetical protein